MDRPPAAFHHWFEESVGLDLRSGSARRFRDRDEEPFRSCFTDEAGLLQGVILCCPHPNALVRRVDDSAVDRIREVRAVLSSSTPEANPFWPAGEGIKTRLFDPHCRRPGERVAAIAATELSIALAAARGLRIEYDILPGENSCAAEKGALMVKWPAPPYFAEWRGEELNLWGPVLEEERLRATIAEVLEIPPSLIRILGIPEFLAIDQPHEPKDAIIAALLARATGRPVRMALAVATPETFH